MTVQHDIPRALPVGGTDSGSLIARWLGHPRLERAILISFAFDERLGVDEIDGSGGISLIERLETAAVAADVTLVLSREAAYATGRRGEGIRGSFQRLDVAGIQVLLHPTLHAKIYLFAERSRVCWIVGSTNLTAGGFGNNAEVNLRGFHPVDYAQVERMAATIISEATPYWQ